MEAAFKPGGAAAENLSTSGKQESSNVHYTEPAARSAVRTIDSRNAYLALLSNPARPESQHACPVCSLVYGHQHMCNMLPKVPDSTAQLVLEGQMTHDI